MRIALTLGRDASKRDRNDYVDALVRAGFAREDIAVIPPGSLATEEFDGLVLGGGVDVDPARYGARLREDARVEVDRARDATDFAALERALGSGAPTLAICRGLQVVNVALGGTLVQDLPSERPDALTHDDADANAAADPRRLEHAVRVAPGTRLAQIAQTEELPVNSRHHQAIDRVAPELTVSAVAPDGVIEAVERERPWLLGVQWHPENLAGSDPASRRIFEEFAAAVAERALARR